MQLVKPPRLRAGDRIAAVTLSWGGPGTFPHRYAAGKRQLEEAFGVEVVEMPNTLADPDEVAAHPEQRIDDLHAAFADPSINGVISTIGGDDSIRTLRHTDLDLLAANPKVFLGFSDSTITNLALLRAGIVSFYGPSIMAGFGENAGMHDHLIEGVRRTLFEPEDRAIWPENTAGWTVEELDWADTANQERPRTMQPSTGRRWHGGMPAEGTLLPVCLEVLDFTRGTAWWPDLRDTILLLETSEEAPPPDVLARFLRTLAATGELASLAGLGLGIPGGDVPVEEHGAYEDALLQVVRTEEGLRDLPLVTGLDFGHTSPVWTLPIGTRMRIDPEEQELTFLEAGVT